MTRQLDMLAPPAPAAPGRIAVVDSFDRSMALLTERPGACGRCGQDGARIVVWSVRQQARGRACMTCNADLVAIALGGR